MRPRKTSKARLSSPTRGPMARRKTATSPAQSRPCTLNVRRAPRGRVFGSSLIDPGLFAPRLLNLDWGSAACAVMSRDYSRGWRGRDSSLFRRSRVELLGSVKLERWAQTTANLWSSAETLQYCGQEFVVRLPSIGP